MPDFNVRSDSVDVEQIMKQIRARVREKRGADYTETEIQQLAKVKLEKFLDARGVRSDLIQHYRRQPTPPSAPPPNYEFGEMTLYETHRGLLQSLRHLLRPILKLFFNPDKLTAALHIQAAVNTQGEQRLRRQEELEEQRSQLYYELLHNLTVEITRLGIEVHNMKMRIESLSSRLDFDERRARSLEGVVQYRQDALRPASAAPAAPAPTGPTPTGPAPTGERQDAGSSTQDSGGFNASRRRRRRRRRRPGQTLAETGDANGNRPPGGAAPETSGRDDATSGPASDAPDDGDASDTSDL